MKAFRFLFMLIGLMLFSTGIRASVTDQKESSKTVVAFDVGKTAITDYNFTTPTVDYAIAEVQTFHENFGKRLESQNTITQASDLLPALTDYTEPRLLLPEYNYRC